CEVNFTKEIEFEHFRANYTYEEAEEIRMEFEKLGTWFERGRERDWFDAPHRRDAERWLAKCERLLEDFEAKVFEVLGTGEGPAAPARRGGERLPGHHGAPAGELLARAHERRVVLDRVVAAAPQRGGLRAEVDAGCARRAPHLGDPLVHAEMVVEPPAVGAANDHAAI